MSISQSSTVAENYQSFELIPLISITTKSSDKFYFQLSDQKPLMVDNVVFYYLNGSLRNVSGSSIPYTPYRYRFTVSNNRETLSPQTSGQQNTITSLRRVLDEENGLRDCVMNVYYYYPSSERMDRQGTFIINQTTIATERIIFDLINDIR